MSLAINAAPFDNEESVSHTTSSNNMIAKRARNNRTIKMRPQAKLSSENINNVLSNTIHGNADGDDDDNGGGMGDFMPMDPPMSMGVEQAKARAPPGPVPAHPDGASGDSPQSSNNPDFDKYRQFMPNYQQMYGSGVDVDHLAPTANVNAIYGPGASPSFPTGASSGRQTLPGSGTGDPLIDKLNHVIHLLEEQKDDKTERVNEEVVLYFFLGIFVIFIVDSFTRLGKYTR